MSTLQQLRANFYDLIREAENDHFTAAQANGLLNQGKDFLAVLSNSSTDRIDVTTEQSKGAYTLPSDTLLINNAYFGDVTVSGDIGPLKIITEKVLTNLFPSWQDETTDADGEPSYLLKLDRQTIYVHPRPDADNAGKKIILNYGYLPANMSSDSDSPDIPPVFHNLIPFYAAYLAYLSLSNTEVARQMYRDFINQYNTLKDVVDREADDIFRWKWISE